MYNWLHSIEWQNVHNLEHFRHLYTSANALEKINNRFSIAGLPLWSWENAISKMYKNSHNSVEKKKEQLKMSRGSTQTFSQRRHTKNQQIHENHSTRKYKWKPQWDITSHTHILVGMVLSEKQKITSVGEDVEKREHLCTVDGTINWFHHCGKQYGSFSKNRTTKLSTNSTLFIQMK